MKLADMPGVQEISDPNGVSWIGPNGTVLLWNRYTRTFKFALSNRPGTVPSRVEASPWRDGASTVAQARDLAWEFHKPRDPNDPQWLVWAEEERVKRQQREGASRA